MVTGRIYEISKNFGAFVAVDSCFSALIPKKELFGATEPPKIGERVTARVVKVLEDGKLTLSIREKGISADPEGCGEDRKIAGQL